jgi:hypothetical protein
MPEGMLRAFILWHALWGAGSGASWDWRLASTGTRAPGAPDEVLDDDHNFSVSSMSIERWALEMLVNA